MEGKRKYFVLVLFLLLALMIFAFANPIVEDDKEFIDKGNGETEKVETPDVIVDTKDEETTNENNQTQQTTNTETKEEIDYAYEEALKAVQYAEATYKVEDVEKARELVNKVTDTTKKGQLNDRLDEVEAGINVMALLEELEKKIAQSTNRSELMEAKDYRDDEEIATKINALKNETVKASLTTRLNKANKILDNNKAPVVNIENNEVFTDKATIEVEDEAGNDFTIYVTVDGNTEKVENNTEITEEGVYTLKVVDKAFNETEEIRFVVDRTAPVFEGLTNNMHYENVTVKVNDVSNVTIEVVKDHNYDGKTTIANGTELTEEGTYKLTATDEAGLSTTYVIAVDRTDPTIARETDEEYPHTRQTVTVSDRYLTKVEVTVDGETTVYERKDFAVGENNENFSIELNFTKDCSVTIKATDHRGLVSEDTFTIDSTFPRVENVTDGAYYNVPVKPVLVDTNADYATLNGEAYNGEEITADGYYTIVFVDKSGYSVTKSFTIDTTDPTITGVEDENGVNYYQSATPVATDTNLDKVELYINILGKEVPVLTYKNGDTITTDGTYRIVATDKAGNSTEVNFIVDKTAPNVLLLGDTLEVIKGDLIPINPIITEANIESIKLEKKNLLGEYKEVEYSFTESNGIVKGAQVKEAGEYRITVTDKAGNTTVEEFEIDNTAPIIMGKVNGNSIPTPLITGVYQSIELVVEDKNYDTSKILVLKQTSTQKLGPIEIPIYTKYNYTYGEVIDEEGAYLVGAADEAFNISATRIIIDRTAPVITDGNNKNIENDTHYQSLDIIVNDSNPVSGDNLNNGVSLYKYREITIPYVGTIGEYIIVTDYKYGEPVTENGKYKVVASDIAGNTVERYFVIDNQAPTTNVVEGAIYNSITPEINDNYLDTTTITLNGESYIIGTPINVEGEYTLVITDKAGNNVTRNFTIDEDALEITGVENNESYNTNVTPEVVVNNSGITASATISKDNKEATPYTTTTIEATKDNEGTYTITVTDEYNNKTEVTFSIDVTAPVIDETTRTTEQGASVSTNTKIPVDVKVTDNIDAEKTISPVVTHSVKGDLGELSEIEISKDFIGTYTLTYNTTDKAGNAAELVVVTVEVYKADYIIVFDENMAFTYNGTKQYPKAVIRDENGIVEGEITYVIEDGNATDVGTYRVTASTNAYTNVSSVSRVFTIEKREVEVVFDHNNSSIKGFEYEYDGNNNPYTATLVDATTKEYIQDLTITYTDENGEVVTELNKGTYTMKVTNPSELNYNITNDLTQTIIIKKANIEVDFTNFTLLKNKTTSEILAQDNLVIVNGNGTSVKNLVEVKIVKVTVEEQWTVENWKPVKKLVDVYTEVNNTNEAGDYIIYIKRNNALTVLESNYDIQGSKYETSSAAILSGVSLYGEVVKTSKITIQ